MVFSDGKVQGTGHFLQDIEVGIRQSVAHREPSEFLVPHCICPRLTLPGGKGEDRLGPQTHAQFFDPG